MYQPKTGQECFCKLGSARDNCRSCEGTGWAIDFQSIRTRAETGASNFQKQIEDAWREVASLLVQYEEQFKHE